MNVTAVAARSGRWWAVEVPEVDGALTQVRRLDQVVGAVREVVSLLDGASEDSIDVELSVVVDDDVAEALDAVADGRRRAEQLARDASTLLARTTRELVGQGLSLRDVGQVLGLSHQRVAQILRDLPVEQGVPDAGPAGRTARYVARSRAGGRVGGRH